MTTKVRPVYRCSQCRRELIDRGDFFPFCSERCKMLDLGAWASEKYRVPVDEDDSNSSSSDRAYESDDEQEIH